MRFLTVNLLIFAISSTHCQSFVQDIDQGVDASIEIVSAQLHLAIRSAAQDTCSDSDCIQGVSNIISESFEIYNLESYRSLLKHELFSCIHSAPVMKMNESRKDYESRILNYSIKQAQNIQKSFIDHTGQTWNDWRESDFGDLKFKRKLMSPTIFNKLSVNLMALSLAYPAYRLLNIVNKNLFMISYALGILLMNKILFGIWIRPIRLKRKKRRIRKRPVA